MILVERYCRGAHRDVTKALQLLGRITDSSDREQGTEVAFEVMGRVRTNLLTLSERFKELGYTFKRSPLGTPIPRARLDDLQSALRELPMMVAPEISQLMYAFYTCIGSVDFSGDGEPGSRWGARESMDPIQILPLPSDEVLAEQVYRLHKDNEWLQETPDSDEPFLLSFEHDAVVKAGSSGGPLTEVGLLGGTFDATLFVEGEALSGFLDYLRKRILNQGGLTEEDLHDGMNKREFRKLVKDLTANLVPF